MKWYRSRAVTCKLHHRATHNVPKAAKKAAAPDQRRVAPLERERPPPKSGHGRQMHGIMSADKRKMHPPGAPDSPCTVCSDYTP
eukprot:1346680-Prymnesium_polylepis.1